ncbi:hypothetical protein [Kocuria palustris]|uniref:hypothetical protein n=1 Tax=Kocuria palustris TaxID=71999 RepID=UPI0011A09DAA|nr:hypothetical protein [Kocuria palustris]
MKARRRLLPWRSRTRRWIAWLMDELPASPASSTADDPISAFLGLLLLIVILPLLPLFLLESLAQWLALPFALIARRAGLAAVPLVVTEGRHAVHRESVLGWTEADERLTAIRREISHGSPHPWRDRSDPWTSSNQPGW